MDCWPIWNLGRSFADIVIRTMDTAEALGINLHAAILSKMAYNRRRTRMHGGKAL